MDSSIPIWIPITIACGISVWAILSVLGSERQRRQALHPMDIAPPAPPVNAPASVKAVATKDDAKKTGRVAA